MTCLPMFAKCLPMAIMCFKASLKQIKKMFAKCLPQNRCICKDVCQIYPLGYLANMANIPLLAVIISKKCLPTYLNFKMLGKHLFFVPYSNYLK